MKKKYLKYGIVILLSIIFFAFGLMLFFRSYKNYEIDIIEFQEKGNVDYKVYLNENNFFEQPFLGPGQAYITTLIDYIDVDFKYNFSTKDNRSGDYVYYINAGTRARRAVPLQKSPLGADDLGRSRPVSEGRFPRKCEADHGLRRLR